MDTHHRAIDQMQAGATESCTEGRRAVAVNGIDAALANVLQRPLHELDEMLNNAVKQARSIC